ncbi:MAG: hypothetical protein KAV25_06240 [Methanophagales archaeon]|nr:hypothetical protein [Methanophagales archaeon]
MIDQASFKSTEERIKLAIELTAAIDRINEMPDFSMRQKRLMQLKPKLDTMLSSVINEKRYMEWPASEGEFTDFSVYQNGDSGIFTRWVVTPKRALSKNPVIYHRGERRARRVYRQFQLLLRFSGAFAFSVCSAVKFKDLAISLKIRQCLPPIPYSQQNQQ